MQRQRLAQGEVEKDRIGRIEHRLLKHDHRSEHQICPAPVLANRVAIIDHQKQHEKEAAQIEHMIRPQKRNVFPEFYHSIHLLWYILILTAAFQMAVETV